MRGAVRGTLLLAFLAGCGFSAIKDPQDLTNGDLAGADFAGVDLAAPPGSDLAVRGLNDLAQKPPCAGPLLFITVENVHNGASGGGRVHILQLGDGSNLPADCTTLSAQGLMTPQPFSAAMVSGKLAVMGIEALQLVDPS